MSALATLAVIVLAVWMGALSILTALLVRQVSLLTHRMDPDYALDGLPRGRRIPAALAEFLPNDSGGVLVLGAGCAPCRKLASELQTLVVEQPVVAVIEGDPTSAAALAAFLPPGVQVVTGEEAARAYSALQLETTPFAFFVQQREIVEKAVLKSALHFQALLRELVTAPRHPHLQGMELSNVG